MKKTAFCFLVLLLLLCLPSCEKKPDMQKLLACLNGNYQCEVTASGENPLCLYVEKKDDTFRISKAEEENASLCFVVDSKNAVLECNGLQIELSRSAIHKPVALAELLSCRVGQIWKVEETVWEDHAAYCCSGTSGTYYISKSTLFPLSIQTEETEYRFSNFLPEE